MKLFITATNKKGKQAKLGDNEYLDIDLYVGNERLASLTVRELDANDGEGFGVYDFDDGLLWKTKGKKQKGKSEKCKYCGQGSLDYTNLENPFCHNCKQSQK